MKNVTIEKTSGGYLVIRFETPPSVRLRGYLKSCGYKYYAYENEWVGKRNESEVRKRCEIWDKIPCAQRQTLCWGCRNSSRSGCSWSKRFEPVQGWEAIRNERTDSYHVVSCPLYDAEARKEAAAISTQEAIWSH